MKTLKKFFLLTDITFLVYWISTALHIIPMELAFSDYTNSLVVIWNWSFLPLDMCISFTGFTTIYLYNKGNSKWNRVALISLIFTMSSGLQAISFWAIKGDFDVLWWIANLYLIIYPLFFLNKLINNKLK